MTSQVVLYNKLGVAIASDSAVTSYRGKVLMGSEKIFDLPAPHKVAVLTSGLSSFMTYPWEVVFSAWSETLTKPLESVAAYSLSLGKFLRNLDGGNEEFSPIETSYLRRQIGQIADEVLEILGDVLSPYFKERMDSEEYAVFMEPGWSQEFRAYCTDLLDDDIKNKAIAEVTSYLEFKESFPQADAIPESQALVWVEEFWKSADSTFVQRYMNDWPSLPNFDSLINTVFSRVLLHPDPDAASEICIVGYGEKDLLPTASFFSMYASIRGALIKNKEQNWPAGTDTARLFFGQYDAMLSLFSAEDPLYTSTAENAQREVLGSLVEKLASRTDESALLVRDYVEQSMSYNSVGAELRKVGEERRSQPFFRAISMAPIIDLAEFASQLVGIQSAYSSMQQDNPTVGGPIDVAVITHRGGFEWIKHK